MVTINQIEAGAAKYIDAEIAPKIPVNVPNGQLKKVAFLTGAAYAVRKGVRQYLSNPLLAQLGAVDADGNVDLDGVLEAARGAVSEKGFKATVPIAESDAVPHLDRQLAEKWVSGMKNRDGTTGPHFSWAKTQEIMQQHTLDYDPVKFWVALNATYSDMCAFFRKYNVNTIGAYVDHTIDFWFEDQDAVENKLAAYYACVVRH